MEKCIIVIHIKCVTLVVYSINNICGMIIIRSSISANRSSVDSHLIHFKTFLACSAAECFCGSFAPNSCSKLYWSKPSACYSRNLFFNIMSLHKYFLFWTSAGIYSLNWVLLSRPCSQSCLIKKMDLAGNVDSCWI